MPHRRRIKKGSFGSHFDELVKHVPDDETAPDAADRDKRPDERHINDKLFESAWRKPPAVDQSSRFSNQ